MIKKILGKLKRDWIAYAAVILIGLPMYAFLPDTMRDSVPAILHEVGGFIFKVAVRGGILYAFAQYDFTGVDFKAEIRKGNLAAAVAFLALAVVATSI